MGVVNVTPASFSDDGAFLHPAAAIAEARGMVEEGAAIIDIGGESTRPGSEGVSLEEELQRVEPVLHALLDVPRSIDTSKAEVARRAVEAGAVMVNDVTALRGDPDLAGVVADADAYLCLMHILELLGRLDEIVALGRPVLVGASRKRFLGRVLGDPDAVTGPVAAGIAVAVLAYERGASIVRAHDVREHVAALKAAQAVVESPA